MSYWPFKFHTYIQPWLTGLWGIITHCCYRDQRTVRGKAIFIPRFFIYEDKTLFIVQEIHDYQSAYQCMHTNISHTHGNRHRQTVVFSHAYTHWARSIPISSYLPRPPCHYGMTESHIVDCQPPRGSKQTIGQLHEHTSPLQLEHKSSSSI